MAQAKKLFQTPGLRYDHWLTRSIIDGWSKGGMNVQIEEFIKMILPVFRSDHTFLFERLVHTFDKDPDKIQEIWVLMQEHGYTPSDQIGNVQLFGNLTFSFCTLGGASKLNFNFWQMSLTSLAKKSYFYRFSTSIFSKLKLVSLAKNLISIDFF